MKLLRTLFAMCLICALAGGFSFSQEKSKDKNKNSPPVEVKANVAVLDASGKLFEDVKIEDLKIFEDGVEQKLTYFAKKQPLLNLGLVFDNSGSMRKTIDVITEMPSIFTDYLNLQDEVFVMRFVDNDKIELNQDWTANKKDLNETIENLFVEAGQSAVLDAVYLAAEKISEREKKDKSMRYALILISDGEERESFYSLEKIEKLLNGSELQIFVISFAENAPLNKKVSRFVSNILTLKTGGTTYTLPKKFTKDDIVNSVKSIIGELRSQYIIGYTSTNPNRDGLMRKLTVQVADSSKGEKRQAIIREGFVVPKK